MFTGLVAGTGKLLSRDRRGPGYRLVVGTAGLAGFDALELGESIAVSGACLTVIAQTNSSFDADVSLETTEKTTLGSLALGSDLNLERSLRVGDRLGGHWVSGHVDGIGRIVSVEPPDTTRRCATHCHPARASANGSMPGCSKNPRSS